MTQILKTAKQATLALAKTAGVLNLVRQSEWRRRRLLILGYHGISLRDEHLWNSSHFISADLFRQRLMLIKRSGCTVLPLGEAIGRLYSGDLPDRAIAITFDDGTIDFYEKAFPILKEFNFPVTLYLTTFYMHYRKPIFDLMSSYLLWKGRRSILDLGSITGRDAQIQLAYPAAREAAAAELRAFAQQEKLSADEKDFLARSLAVRLKTDYDELLARRFLHIVSPHQLKDMSRQGVDVQLHAHRHRTPRDRDLFIREIEDNRNSIAKITGRNPTHFCYPNGTYAPQFPVWLADAGVVSATTCDTGLASMDSNRFLLPRVLDVSSLSSLEFEGWLTGVSARFPRRPVSSPAQRSWV